MGINYLRCPVKSPVCVFDVPYSCVRVFMSMIDALQHQLAAYVSWVNSQLKRKPGLKPISNLRLDLQDGVVLSHLIEIVG